MVNYQVPVPEDSFSIYGKLRIVLLCDLHNQSYGKDNEELIRQIHNQDPDLVAVAGDMFTPGQHMEEEETLRLMSKLASHYPVCYANGNHESQLEYYPEYFKDRYPRYVEHLKEIGVHFLDNERIDLDLKGLPMRIYGLTLPWKFYRRFCYRRFTVEGMRECLGEGTKERYQLLLAHNPMSFPAYAGWGADLTLSGHLHGGFLRLPLVGGIISPQCVPFPKYDRGLFEENGHYLAVSAGLGTHDKLPRIGNPPELVVIDLQNNKGR